ncbi:MAG: hypothetical protein ABIO70_24360 [Pseudomonadota bacterium]
MLPLLLHTAAEPRDILVLGTLHQGHRKHPTYSYDTVARLIEAFDPAVVCVEIRPEDFRREPYLDEMELATIWGLAEERAVVPMDRSPLHPPARPTLPMDPYPYPGALMRPPLLALLALPTLACVDENDLCTTYDGTACSEVVGDVAALQASLASLQGQLDQLQTDLDAAEATIADQQEALDAQQQDLAAAEATIAAMQASGFLTDDDLADFLVEDDVTDLRDDVADHEARITAVEADYLQSADLAGYATEAWVTSQGYLTASGLTGYATQSWVTAGFAPLTTATDHEARIAAIEDDYVISTDVSDAVRLISTDTTYSCADAADVLGALAELDGLRIAGDVTVTLALDATNFAFTAPLSLSHPDGDRIEVVGAGVDQTYLTFTSSDGVVVEGASSLGYLGDLSIVGADQDAYGLYVRESSALTVGSLGVQGFADVGIRVAGNASLQTEEEALVDVSGCGIGIVATESSYANVTGASSSGNTGDGFHAAHGSALVATSASSSGNVDAGFQAMDGSVIYADASTASGNANVDYYALHHSLIMAQNAEASGVGHSGFYANTGSYIYAQGASASVDSNFGFAAMLTSAIYAPSSDVQGTPSAAYGTNGNSYIYAPSTVGLTTKSTSYNDTTDFIYPF